MSFFRCPRTPKHILWTLLASQAPKDTLSHPYSLSKHQRRPLVWVSRSKLGYISFTLWIIYHNVHVRHSQVIKNHIMIIKYFFEMKIMIISNTLNIKLNKKWSKQYIYYNLRSPNPLIWAWKKSLVTSFVKGSINILVVEICSKTTSFCATMPRM